MEKLDKKELYEYKLDLLYYGINLEEECYKLLKKGINNQVSHNDYITTKGLMLRLDSKIYVSADVIEDSPYSICVFNNCFFLKKGELLICKVDIIQPPEFALKEAKIGSGELVTDFINIHGDRARIQPIEGCANVCKFCDLNRKFYKLQSLDDLDEAFQYALNNVCFRHVLISGGTPFNRDEDYEYLNNVYKYFGLKYGDEFPIDVMLVPRGLDVNSNNTNGYAKFLRKLKEWKITGLSVNLELNNDDYRLKYIPQKHSLGKENYFEFIKMAIEIFGRENVRSCIVVGLESVQDSLTAVEDLCKIGCMPVLCPYIPSDEIDVSKPNPKFMKEVLLGALEIADRYNVKLGPLCDSCKHNTLLF